MGDAHIPDHGVADAFREAVRALDVLPDLPPHAGDHEAVSVRTAVHHGHDIRVETRYRITVDGAPLEGHIEVLDNGTVHYHGLPQYAVSSAIELVRIVLDYFGTRPPADDELGGAHPPHPPHGSTHGEAAA